MPTPPRSRRCTPRPRPNRRAARRAARASRRWTSTRKVVARAAIEATTRQATARDVATRQSGPGGRMARRGGVPPRVCTAPPDALAAAGQRAGWGAATGGRARAHARSLRRHRSAPKRAGESRSSAECNGRAQRRSKSEAGGGRRGASAVQKWGKQPNQLGLSDDGELATKKAPDVENFAWLPVGVNSKKPARGSVSLI